MTGILVPDWQEQVTAEQRARNAALTQAATGGASWPVVDRAVMRCHELDEVRRYALLLDEALKRAGWSETRACYGRLDEGER